MERTLYGLRVISVLGFFIQAFLLVLNLILGLFFKSLDRILLYSWKLFFIVAMLALVAALAGYFSNKPNSSL